MNPDLIQQLLIQLPVLVFSIVVHEVAHGWVALKQGDDTALMLGRITLNPVPHIDPVGSIIVPVIMALAPGNAILGWAKPVPVNPRKYRNYKRGDILVSLAGVASNFVLAILFALLLAAVAWLAVLVPSLAGSWAVLAQMCQVGVVLNFILIVFNLLPVPPLDGSHVFYHLLPPRLGAQYRAVGGYGMIILVVLLYAGAFRVLLVPVRYMAGAAFALTGLLAPR